MKLPVVVGIVAICGAGWAVPPAGATHAYRCDLVEDPKVRQAACLPHHLWDAITGGDPAQAACALERVLGVDNVKECP